ncbi:MAG: PilZ domain-containing protein [Candidatus Firestonebacteria bacterium]
MADERNFFLDKRRFPRVSIKLEVTVFSSQRTLLGNGELRDISASGLKFETPIMKGIYKGGEVIVSFTLPDGPKIEKLRCEIKAVTKSETGYVVCVRFTELKAIDLLRDYVESRITTQ